MEREPEDQQHFLCFENYHKVLSDNLNRLLRKQMFDITLVCAGAELKAHQFILSACSPLFESILTNHPHAHPIACFNDVSKEEMSALLEYMYKGQVHILESFLPDVLNAARKLKIRGLENMESNVCQESPTQFSGNGYQDCLDTVPEVSSQQEQTLRTSSLEIFSTPATLNARDLENQHPDGLRPLTTVPTAATSSTTVPAHTISTPTIHRYSPRGRGFSGTVRHPFTRKSEDSDTTFCDDYVAAILGPSKVPTEQEATNNNDSDVEFIGHKTQEDKDSPPWYSRRSRHRKCAKGSGQSSRLSDKAGYKSDDSDSVIVRKKSSK